MATTKQYAYLSEHVYEREVPLGVNPIKDPITIGDTSYKILYNASNPLSGYQGMVYQKIPNGEIIVAHRGTETSDPLDAKADLDMLRSRGTSQVKDALALTEWATKEAKRQQSSGNLEHAPSISITGHSLGGALAEITAHKFGLYGEAFNGYGAASLKYDVPRGGNRFTNHVMAGDPVSAASPHYGKVVIYASAQDVQVIGNYERNQDRTGAAISAAKAMVVSDHTISNFTGSKNPNILNDPAALDRARTFAVAIAHFREEVKDERWLASVIRNDPINQIRAYQESWTDRQERLRLEEAERHQIKSMHDVPPRLRSDAVDVLPTPTLAQTEQTPAIDPIQAQILARIATDPDFAQQVSLLMDGQATSLISTITQSQANTTTAILMEQSNIVMNDMPQKDAPSPAETDQPIKLPRNIASLHDQITQHFTQGQFGNQLAHLSEKDQQTAIALATQEGIKLMARSVDYVWVNPEGKVCMAFDGDKGYSSGMNLNQVRDNEANQVLSASVDLQQSREHEIMMKQEQIRNQSGPVMSI